MDRRDFLTSGAVALVAAGIPGLDGSVLPAVQQDSASRMRSADFTSRIIKGDTVLYDDRKIVYQLEWFRTDAGDVYHVAVLDQEAGELLCQEERRLIADISLVVTDHDGKRHLLLQSPRSRMSFDINWEAAAVTVCVRPPHTEAWFEAVVA